MNVVVTGFVAWLVRTSWQAAILIGLVIVLQWILRNRLTPAWRYNLWLIVAIRLALPVSMESGFSIFNFIAPKTGSFAGNTPPESSPAAAPMISLPLSEAEDSVNELGSSETLSPVAEELTSPTVILGSSTEAKPPRHFTFGWMAFGWMFGASLVGLRFAWQNIRFHASLRSQTHASDQRGEALELLRQSRESVGLSWQPDLIETACINTPALYGFWRPRLLLPTGMIEQFDRNELRFVFLHELAHLKRHDTKDSDDFQF